MTPEQQALIADVRAKSDALAAALVAANDAGIGHPFILPQLVASFRDAFGSEPPNFGELLKVVNG